VSNAGLLAEQEVEDVRGLFGRHQTIVENRGQTASLGGMQRVFLTPGPLLVHAQGPSEDQGDCPKMTQMNVGQDHLGLAPRRPGQLAGSCDRRQAVVPGADVLDQTFDSRE
jgi:hypothetical protein